MRLFLITAILATLVSCGSGEQKATGIAMDAGSDRVYSFVPDSTRFTWTAYKFTDKVGVPGTFDTIRITGTKPASNLADVFRNAAFEIRTNSLNTGIADRDMKIKTHFFGNLKGNETMTGTVKSIDGTGKGVFTLNLNEVQGDVPFQLSMLGDRVKLTAKIDVVDYLAMDAINALNKICEDLHKGTDGVSKLWSEVKLELNVMVNKAVPVSP